LVADVVDDVVVTCIAIVLVVLVENCCMVISVAGSPLINVLFSMYVYVGHGGFLL
jgi:hypothetical protein